MGNLTQNISKNELRCKCKNCNVTILPEEPVIQLVQDACDFFAVKYAVDKVILEITSAARCYVWNRTPIEHGVPGSNDNSQHPRACAIDHKIFLPDGTQIPPDDVYDYYHSHHPLSLGLGKYNNFTHVDTRPIRARWNKTK